MKFFISYSHKDSGIAHEMVNVCQDFNIDTFLDEKNILWGNSITATIKYGLRACTHLVVVLSPASRKSPWVAYEVGRATERGIPILPFLTLPDIDLPEFLGDSLRISSIEEFKKQVQTELLQSAQTLQS